LVLVPSVKRGVFRDDESPFPDYSPSPELDPDVTEMDEEPGLQQYALTYDPMCVPPTSITHMANAHLCGNPLALCTLSKWTTVRVRCCSVSFLGAVGSAESRVRWQPSKPVKTLRTKHQNIMKICCNIVGIRRNIIEKHCNVVEKHRNS